MNISTIKNGICRASAAIENIQRHLVSKSIPDAIFDLRELANDFSVLADQSVKLAEDLDMTPYRNEIKT